METFLNEYMKQNRDLRLHSGERVSLLFEKTIEVVYRCIGKKAFRPRTAINAAVYDAVMVGLARRLEHGDVQDCDSIKRAYDSLFSDEDFITAVSDTTSSPDRVNRRIEKAQKVFKDVK